MFTSWYNTSAARPGADDGVEVLTLHAAKGREWHTVVIAGAEKGLLPHASARVASQKAEEVRLAYVAITRAAERLHVTWSRLRNGRKTTPSPFIVDLPLGESTRAPMPDELVEIARNTHTGTLVGALRNWRRTRALQLGVTEVAVCADGLLQRIADAQPRSASQLAELVGPLTAESIGPSLLPVVARFARSDAQ
jgi:DNA helicase-2/ATP-dependent DNA helicase PcrA